MGVFAPTRIGATNADQLDELIGGWSATMDANPLLELLAHHGVPSGRVFTALDALGDPHYAARHMVQRLTSAHGTDMPVTGVVPRFSRTPGTLRWPGPALGAHTDEVKAELSSALADRPSPP